MSSAPVRGHKNRGSDGDGPGGLTHSCTTDRPPIPTNPQVQPDELDMIDHVLVTPRLAGHIASVYMYHGYPEGCDVLDSDHWCVAFFWGGADDGLGRGKGGMRVLYCVGGFGLAEPTLGVVCCMCVCVWRMD